MSFEKTQSLEIMQERVNNLRIRYEHADADHKDTALLNYQTARQVYQKFKNREKESLRKKLFTSKDRE